MALFLLLRRAGGGAGEGREGGREGRQQFDDRNLHGAWRGGKRGEGRKGRAIFETCLFFDADPSLPPSLPPSPPPQVTGVSPDVWMQENIFGPLNMEDTAFAVPMSKINRYR